VNTLKAQQQETKVSDLKARCQALLDKGERVAAVKLYRSETRASLPAAMQALGLK